MWASKGGTPAGRGERRREGATRRPDARPDGGAQGRRGPTPAAGLGSRGSGRGATFFAFSSSGSFWPIDTCAGPTPAANIFLMSSRGLERARSALQGGFSPGRCFGRRRCEGPRGGGTTTNLSLGEASAEDFLLKFKRKTGFHSAPKNVFPGGQWASFCASRAGGAGTRAPSERPAEARRPGLQGTKAPCGPGRGAWGAPRPVTWASRGRPLPQQTGTAVSRAGGADLWARASNLVLSALHSARGNK